MMNVPWVCYTCHALLFGGVGLAYRAWNSVVFLLYSGIAKPLSSVKNDGLHAFCMHYLQDCLDIVPTPFSRVSVSSVCFG